MTVQISSQAIARLHNVSDILKVNETTLLERAIKYYTTILEKELQLKKEFNEWDTLSDEALINFEKTL